MDNNQLPKSNSEAKALGKNKYFTGIPCKRGHIAFRYAGGGCSECLKLKLNQYRKEDPDRYKKYEAEFRERHREELREANRKRYHEDPEKHLMYARRYREKSKHKLSSIRKKSYRKNAEKRRAEAREWGLNNRDAINETRRKHYMENRHKVRAYNDLRQAEKKKRVPNYYSEFDEFVHSECVSLVDERARLHGFDWQIDHCIPLMARKACGLHTGWNLQVIPRSLNAKKCNRMIYTEPLEWLSDAT